MKEKKTFNCGNCAPLPCEIYVCVKLFTTSEFSTFGKCYLKEDTVLSGGAPGSQQAALHFSNTIERPSHTEKPFPAHTRKGDKQVLNNYSSAVWVVLQICVEKYLPELFNLHTVISFGLKQSQTLNVVSLHLISKHLEHFVTPVKQLFSNLLFNPHPLMTVTFSTLMSKSINSVNYFKTIWSWLSKFFHAALIRSFHTSFHGRGTVCPVCLISTL